MKMAATPLDVETLARDLGSRINEQLPRVLQQLLADRVDSTDGPLQLECSLSSRQHHPGRPRVTLASIDIETSDIGSSAGSNTPAGRSDAGASTPIGRLRPLSYILPEEAHRPTKRHASMALSLRDPDLSEAVFLSDGDPLLLAPDQNALTLSLAQNAPSRLKKFIGGVWDNIFSGLQMDPVQAIEQWQAIESSRDPQLLSNANSVADASAVYGRMNALTRKISQTTRICRSLEVIVQAHWVWAFDERVTELSQCMTQDKAKKNAMSEACLAFGWSEKELRNKTAIWRGYYDIKNSGGWAALVFAGTGLYRFCKYRSFSADDFENLRCLRHRFEVAADTLHPRWRALLAIISISTDVKYTGHHHDWVVCGPDENALPLATTYHKWDKRFSFTHLTESVIDEEAWDDYDPRTATQPADSGEYICTLCDQIQSNDAAVNACICFPSIYGKVKASFIPVQVFQTTNGKNNGLLTCCSFPKGTAVGEFIGQITSGLSNTDLMVGHTDNATYQIWQGKQGNYLRFVNHSCNPNTEFQRFVWLGIQRIVLVSKGIEADEEITVDYSDTYWENLDKECLCGQLDCRYRSRRIESS